jgi:hypothetical protein
MNLLKFSMLICTTIFALQAQAQTETDGLMMGKRNICGGLIYGHSRWTNYWEGTYYRNNDNIGSITSNSITAMVNYGITSKLNIIAMAPWISNKATAGTLIGQSGIQDLSLAVKNEFWAKEKGGFNSSACIFLGGSTPLSNYVADYLPLSLGLGSTNAYSRLLVDVQKGNWFGTASAAYMVRSNVTIDRTAYYTTELIYSNKVAMPDVAMFNVRAGWRRGADLILEAVFDRMNTIGGFDMRKNDMPFLSNNMDATRIGLNFKLPVPKINGLSLVASGFQTLAGRNMGKSTSFMIGAVYQAEFVKGEKK